VRDAETDIWVWSLERATLTRLTFDQLFDRFPVSSPDGRRIAFSSQRDGSRGNVFWQTVSHGRRRPLAGLHGRRHATRVGAQRP
jgi:Tol biopolymer transport system component